MRTTRWPSSSTAYPKTHTSRDSTALCAAYPETGIAEERSHIVMADDYPGSIPVVPPYRFSRPKARVLGVRLANGMPAPVHDRAGA
jgi:hypothetical protein